MTLRVRLFGSSSVEFVDKTVTLRGKAALLLGVLVREKRAVKRAWLADLLHPNSKSARKNLTVTLVRLQKAIGYDLIVGTPQTLSLRQDSDVWIDCWAWEQESQLIRQSNDADSIELSQRLEEVVRLYRGAFLATQDNLDNVDAYNWLLIERARFEKAYAEHVEHLLQLYQRAQRDEAVLRLITTALVHVPTHEPLYITYMQVLARLGQAQKALHWGERQKRRLRIGLGHNPSEQYDAALDAVRLYDSSKQPKRKQARFTPPVGAKAIFGRKSQANQIANQLLHHSARLITLLGIGGIGKTVLAVETATIVQPLFRNGVLWISFADLLEQLDAKAAHEQIVSRLASALGLEISQDFDELTERVVTQLAKHHVLLVLDNFESVVAGVTFVSHLLQQVVHLAILVTSRQRLQLVAEQIVQVFGLATSESAESDSVKLFVHRARLKAPQFMLDEGKSADVIEICRKLGGHPLAVELAAYWVNIYPPKDILNEIGQSDELLINPYIDASARQQSIDVILNYTWRQLTPDTQSNLLKLSIFQDQFNAHAARQVCNVTPVHLDTLLQRGLIQPHASSWFSLHPLVRAFVRDKFNRSSTQGTVEQAYFTYFLGMLDFEDDLWNSLPIRYAIRDNNWLAQEADLLKAWQLGLQHNAHQRLANGVRALIVYCCNLNRVPFFMRLLQQSYEQLESREPATHTTIWYERLLVRLDTLLARHGLIVGVDRDTILSRAHGAYSRALEVETQSWQHYTQFCLGRSALNVHRFKESFEYHLSLFETLTLQGTGLSRRIAGIALLHTARLLRLPLTEVMPDWESFVLNRRENVLEELFEAGSNYIDSTLFPEVISIEQEADDLEAAIALCREHEDLIDKRFMTWRIGRLMTVYLILNDFQRARELGDELFYLFDQMNFIHDPVVHNHQINYGYILAQVGEINAATQVLKDLLKRTYANATVLHSDAHTTLGNIYFDNDQLGEANQQFFDGLRLGVTTPSIHAIVMSLLQLARINRHILPFDLYAAMVSVAAHSRRLFPSFRPIAKELYTTEIEPHCEPFDPAQLDYDQLAVLGERVLVQLSETTKNSVQA